MLLFSIVWFWLAGVLETGFISLSVLSPSYTETHFVKQADLKLTEFASAFSVLGLKECVTMPG